MLKQIFDSQKAFSKRWTKHINSNKEKLIQLKAVLLKYENQIIEALNKDLNKNKFEAYSADYKPVLEEIEWFIEHYDDIYRKKVVPQKLSTSPFGYVNPRLETILEPYGNMMVYAPYNFPLNLSFIPLIGAIATGNTVMLKPSKVTSHINQVMKDMVEEVFAPEQAYVLSREEIEAQETYEQLYSFDFDIVFFTGNPTVGREIYSKYASKLIPVVLELGGKSPVIVDKSADLEMAAKRIIWAKTTNNGQICIAPDYVLVDQSVAKEFKELLVKQLQEQFPREVEIVRMSSDKAIKRIERLSASAKVIYEHSFNANQKFLIVDGNDLEQPIMKEEIFGPILPVVEYKDLEEAYSVIDRNPDPLAFYIFSNDDMVTDELVHNVKAGGIVVNDLLIHWFNHELPFGGIKTSGVGNYHREYSIKTMTHEKAIAISSRFDPNRYAPYNAEKDAIYADISEFKK
ncbi:aldehyde dehydrogenase family protein [Ureaplasma ceti]|uniref:Aldehyde dehydrogenase n=1 Tax=Ureaplasma ceti TaxID=3119530 RepID=A0ABP9U9S4_9BACT